MKLVLTTDLGLSFSAF